MEEIKNNSPAALKEWFYLFAEAFKEHYLMISVVSTILFFAVCMVFDVAYASEFGFDYFLFGGAYDSYQMAIANYAVLLFFMFLIFCVMLFSVFLDLNRKQAFDYNYKIFLFGILFIFFIASSHSFLSFLGEKSAVKIKNGFAARYDIYTNSEGYKCHAIFGKTVGYFLLWDYQSMRSKIVPSGNVKSLELVVAEPPKPAMNPKFPYDWEEKKLVFLNAKKNWNNALGEKCNQVVNWKGHWGE